MTKFEKWLNTFIEEKGIETELSIQFDDENGNFNIMPIKTPDQDISEILG